MGQSRGELGKLLLQLRDTRFIPVFSGALERMRGFLNSTRR